ncbi:hypothetical protein J3458_000747 [Metarhizium acridum]|uniref:uncharacterized protein n=1 Tax=Metarhizium acridum TaxID=92637 RepID=UPI001C6AABC9|nr:hypothetical protein J3458_000747 [Metarhizium acridum]
MPSGLWASSRGHRCSLAYPDGEMQRHVQTCPKVNTDVPAGGQVMPRRTFPRILDIRGIGWDWLGKTDAIITVAFSGEKKKELENFGWGRQPKDMRLIGSFGCEL